MKYSKIKDSTNFIIMRYSITQLDKYSDYVFNKFRRNTDIILLLKLFGGAVFYFILFRSFISISYIRIYNSIRIIRRQCFINII